MSHPRRRSVIRHGKTGYQPCIRPLASRRIANMTEPCMMMRTFASNQLYAINTQLVHLASAVMPAQVKSSCRIRVHETWYPQTRVLLHEIYTSTSRVSAYRRCPLRLSHAVDFHINHAQPSHTHGYRIQAPSLSQKTGRHLDEHLRAFSVGTSNSNSSQARGGSVRFTMPRFGVVFVQPLEADNCPS